MNLAIENGRIIDPANGIDQVGHLYIESSRIAGALNPPSGFKAEQAIDASGLIVMPGIVDLSARLNGSGQEDGIQAELAAVARGGVTTAVHPPDANPAMDKPSAVESLLQRARLAGKARVCCLGAITQGLAGNEIAPMFALKEAGCIGVGNAHSALADANALRHCMEYAHSCDLPVFLQAEDRSLRGSGVAHEGAVGTRLGLAPVPETAETVAISQGLLLAERIGVRLHFCRVSTARGVELIAEAQGRGMPVSADVGICHLLLTEMDIADYDGNCHLRPPLRTERDRQALLESLIAGTIAAVCSDHQPQDSEAKMRPFPETEPGASCVELLLPLMMRLTERGELPLSTALAALTVRPAQAAGIGRGTLDAGAPADVCLYDPATRQAVALEDLHSQGKNCPFKDWDLPGRVARTLFEGQTVHLA